VKAVGDLELDRDREGLVVDHALEVLQGDDEGRCELAAPEPEGVTDPRDRSSEPRRRDGHPERVAGGHAM
jgi:hypothetical protein